MELTEILISYKNKNQDAVKVSSSVDVYNFILNHWDDDTLDIQENVKMLLLNSSNTILGVYDVSRGGINSTVIDLRLVLSVALKCLASSIILVHNHPSGNINPSEQDREFTKKIKSACKFLEIQLFDHIIITRYDYFSFADNGYI
ncbi:MAG: DNA repair protein [Bacteroidia bacterium]|nr:DNA repair protein [Bacteroidia bacterium]